MIWHATLSLRSSTCAFAQGLRCLDSSCLSVHFSTGWHHKGNSLFSHWYPDNIILYLSLKPMQQNVAATTAYLSEIHLPSGAESSWPSCTSLQTCHHVKNLALSTAQNHSGCRSPVGNHNLIIEVEFASWWFWPSVDAVANLSESLFHRPNMTRQFGCASHDSV